MSAAGRSVPLPPPPSPPPLPCLPTGSPPPPPPSPTAVCAAWRPKSPSCSATTSRPAQPPYTDAEVYAAVASCHPAIEVLETGLDYPVAPELNLAKIADLQLNGGFLYGPACPTWQSIDFSRETVTLAVEGVIRVERTGSNPSGDLRRLLPWLANHGAARTGGLRAGQWITTGSWTGAEFSEARETVDVHFSTLGRVSLRFA